jgi:hypothetical protein
MNYRRANRKLNEVRAGLSKLMEYKQPHHKSEVADAKRKIDSITALIIRLEHGSA